MPELLARLRSELNSLLALTEELVTLESPSSSKTHTDLLSRHLAERLRQSGIRPMVEPRSKVGDIIWGEWPVPGSPGTVLVLCHLDTVHPLGAFGSRVVRRDSGKLYGPGVYDMKSSIAVTLKLQQYLQLGLLRPRRTIRFLYTTDEEIGSFESRQLIEDFARAADFALVLEPPLPGGGLKTSRKGTGVFTLEVFGRAAHAGAAPDEGVNAISELSRQILRVEEFADSATGTTVSVTKIVGGTAENVIPDQAQATFDLRFTALEEGRRVESLFRALSPINPNARIGVLGMIDRPPMTQTTAGLALFEQAVEIGRTLRLDLWGGATGGGSDGSFTAAAGIPTLDGLGVEGGNAHSLEEYILIDALPRSAALLGRLLERL